jgi:SAM-dependent methyltransferase
MTEYSICPWWAGYILASPMRKLAQNPARLLEPFVHTGTTVLEPGPGMGFFTLELARLVGPEGRVIAVDVQPHMIASLRRRAERARLIDRPLLRASGHGPDLADMRQLRVGRRSPKSADDRTRGQQYRVTHLNADCLACFTAKLHRRMPPRDAQHFVSI